MFQEELESDVRVIEIAVDLRQRRIGLVKLAERLVDVYFPQDRSTVGWSDIQGAIDELERRWKLAHSLVGIGDPHQRFDVARVELDCFMEMREAFIPMTLPAGDQRESARSFGVVRRFQSNLFEICRARS